MSIVEIYTDGACRGNPGPGGWGALLSFNGREPQRGANTRNRHAGVHPIFVGLLSRNLARADRPVGLRQ